jgi:AraC-like DNA-binding protein
VYRAPASRRENVRSCRVDRAVNGARAAPRRRRLPLLNEGQALIMASKDAATARPRLVRNEERTVPAVEPDRADAKDGTRGSEATRRRLTEARAFIEREFRRSPSLDEIARAANVSVYHFHRLFRRAYGKTPKRLVDELRVAEVQRLVLAGVPLWQVWREVGFSHQSHMGDRFKQLTGKTPRKWLRSVAATR